MTTAAGAVEVTADEGELIPDCDEPWLPRLRPLAVCAPMLALAAGIGAWGYWTNLDRGVLVGLLVGVLCAALVVLTVVDVMVLRLPDAIVLPLYPVLGLSAVTAVLLGQLSWAHLGTAALCMVGAYALLWLIAVFTGGSLGWGDVKLGGLLGLVLGLNTAWDAALGALILPMILGGIVSLPLMLAGQGKREVPFGPFMAAGALLVLLFPNMLTGLWNPGNTA